MATLTPFRRPSDDYFCALACVNTENTWATADKLGNLIHFQVQDNGEISPSSKKSTGSTVPISMIAISPNGSLIIRIYWNLQ